MRSPESLFGELVDGAYARGAALVAHLGAAAVEKPRPDGRVTVTFRQPLRLGATTRLPMSWQVVQRHALLPSMEADVEVAPLGGDATQLAISAWCTPRPGGVDGALDRVALHRVAEAIVKHFLDRVGHALLAGTTA